MFQHPKELKHQEDLMKNEKKDVNELMKDMEFTKKYTINKITPEQKMQMLLSSREIIKQACQHFQVTEEMLKSPSRKRNLSDIRKIIIHHTKMTVNLPYSNIVNLLGRTNHTTAIIASRKAEDLLFSNDGFKKKYEGFKKSFLNEEEV